MIEVNSAAVVTILGEGCKHEFKVSDILTPATALTRYKTTKLDMCYFGDTINFVNILHKLQVLLICRNLVQRHTSLG